VLGWARGWVLALALAWELEWGEVSASVSDLEWVLGKIHKFLHSLLEAKILDV